MTKSEDTGTALKPHYDVIIIGGGFSGTALSIQLLRQTVGSLSIAVVNRAGLPGRGVAYSTNCDDHLLNVGAGKMSVIPNQPEHFLDWLTLRRRETVRPEDFVPRRLYGEYLEEALTEARNEHPKVVFSWFGDDAISLRLRAGKPLLRLSSGASLGAEIAVLAIGHAPPSSPPEVQAITRRFYSPYAWARDALEGIPNFGTVLILGSGLTAVDQVLALRGRMFDGQIFLLSRRGQLPASHSASVAWPIDWAGELPNTVCAVFKSVRQQAKLASANGIAWQAVIDSLRSSSPQIWQRWPITERKRFLRHARTHWEVSRHRIPPATHDILSSLVANGGLRLVAGRLVRAVEHDGRIAVSLCERGARGLRLLSVDRIVNCTGPANFNRNQDRLVLGLLQDGLARLDPLQIGIETDQDGSLIYKSGELSNRIYAIGPVRKASTWETTAVAEIRGQAVELAYQILTRSASRLR